MERAFCPLSDSGFKEDMTGRKMCVSPNQFITTLTLILVPATAVAQSQPVAVTPGSAAAYVFCPKPKSANTCPVSTVGRWMFKLQHEDDVSDAAKKPDSFRDSAGYVGSSAARLTWNTGSAPVSNRVYVGYGEFKIDPSDSTKGTFSGIVDIPPKKSEGACPAYTDYCSMGQPGGGMDTPLRLCNTTSKWQSSGPTTQTCNTNWSPNTGVVECKMPLGSFGTTYGNGVGNCVAHYVQRRSNNFSCSYSYNQNEYLYQARVYNLQVKNVYDFTDATCTALSN